MDQLDARVLFYLVTMQRQRRGVRVARRELATASGTTPGSVSNAIKRLQKRYAWSYVLAYRPDGTRKHGYATNTEGFITVPQQAALVLMARESNDDRDSRGRVATAAILQRMRHRYEVEDDFWADVDVAIKKEYLIGHRFIEGRPALVEPRHRIDYDCPYLQLLAEDNEQQSALLLRGVPSPTASEGADLSLVDTSFPMIEDDPWIRDGWETRLGKKSDHIRLKGPLDLFVECDPENEANNQRIRFLVWIDLAVHRRVRRAWMDDRGFSINMSALKGRLKDLCETTNYKGLWSLAARIAVIAAELPIQEVKVKLMRPKLLGASAVSVEVSCRRSWSTRWLTVVRLGVGGLCLDWLTGESRSRSSTVMRLASLR